ncbi:MAG: aspartyl protease family protein [Saprospiraceae bacterium]|nr:aspartyl protease family protein [Saprospiraceae bacterium]MCF8249953.1 aspartyl protease family protein [Saprospiraceae bacterium]MCF8279366.1 aspartyl protease family protein [Bacteroidales bacterium]MCF8310057.1 aspartyl protease family protein [Saprospiraceae bacterium]MCF8438957.1 aspartyl protease family protein [Saprospiraceae bacterium]
MKIPSLIAALLFFYLPSSIGQSGYKILRDVKKNTSQSGYEILKDVERIDIPFEFKNNLILVNVTFNNTFPLKFIFDTGAENTILAKRTITDLLGVRYEREFKVLGSDMQTELTAYLVRGIHLKIEDMVSPNQTMLVLEEDYFNFEELLGIQIHGILGANIFKGLSVKINFRNKVITLMKSETGKLPNENYQVLPILVEKNKPYLETFVRTQNDTIVKVKLLVDTGAMLALLLNTDSHPGLKAPENAVSGNIGTGLGGFLKGHVGRVSELNFGDIQCNEVITNFQDYEEGMDSSLMLDRNGIIGNGILSRFDVIIDYPALKMYLQPNKSFKKEFKFDKSGLVVIAADFQLSKYIVHSVISGTPAALAGVLPGDEISRLNFAPAGMLTLERINQILRKKEGKKIVLVVKRNNKKHKLIFNLKKIV